MDRLPAVGFSLLLAASTPIPTAADDRLVRETEPLTPVEEQAALRVPEGFEIRLFAAEPQINKPINIAFDEDGRLWVSSTVEYPYAAKRERWSDALGTRVRESSDAIKILEDTNGDGRADTVTDFADGLNIPTGVLPWHKPEHRAGCIAWSIPNIWYFADTTGDGKADLREVLLGPLGFEKDTHGMCSSFRLGPGGWVYATHGFNNTSHARAADGSEVEMASGNIFRFRPDGSRVEIFTRGQVNPFGLCFDQRGNLYSADCHSSPIYQLLRGATYPHFGKPAGPLGFGPTMIQHTHGSTGICGIAYLHSGVWGEAWDDHILIGNPVNSRVNLDSIRFDGSSPTAVEKPDFVESSDPWFRPVDLCIGPDSALYIADFYNRIIGHYEVPLDHPGRDRERGRIWRIVKTDGLVKAPVAPRSTRIPDPLAALASADPHLQRAAATALQFAPEPEALQPLAELLAKTPPEDTHLRHVLRMAIREHLAIPGAFTDLHQPGPEILEIAEAVPTSESADFLLKAGPIGHPARLQHIARFGTEEARARLIAVLQKPKRDAIADVAIIEQVANALEEGGAPRLRPDLLGWALAIAPRILSPLRADAPLAWTELPEGDSASPWVLQSRPCADGTEAQVLSSLAKGEAGAEQRTGTIRSKPFPAPETLRFWICGHRGNPAQAAHDHNLVRLVDAVSGAELQRAYPPRNDTCQKVEWDLSEHAEKSVRLELIDGDAGSSYAWLGITRIDPALVSVDSFLGKTGSRSELTFLADYLKLSAPAELRDALRPFLPPAPEPPPRQLSKTELVALDQLIADRLARFDSAKADLEHGAVLFQTHCAVCHRVAGKGGLIGPQLDGIGGRGAARLAEDILDPNRNIDANFHLTFLDLKDGTQAAGYLHDERGNLIELVDTTGKTRRFSKADVQNRALSPLSLMPPTFGQTLVETDFHDLLGWLLSTGKTSIGK